MVLILQPIIVLAIVPSRFFFTKGTGVHEKEMRTFEEALRDAGVHTCNFIKTSSVIPPRCKLISKEEGVKLLKPGQITFAIDGEKVFRKGKKHYNIEGQDILVDSIVHTAQGAEKNQFTVVVTLAVFIYEN